jgi:hypothetical protein
MKPWLNVSEAAEYGGLSRDTIYTACEQEELRSARGNENQHPPAKPGALKCEPLKAANAGR